MSAFCPEGCPDADACVVGYPCTLHPKPHQPQPEPDRLRILRYGQDKRPKFARDYALGISVERVRAQVSHQCAAGKQCDFENHEILWETEYIKVQDMLRGRRARFAVGKLTVLTEDYHRECVPERARAVVRFLLEAPNKEKR